jgi:hypothetical protein
MNTICLLTYTHYIVYVLYLEPHQDLYSTGITQVSKTHKHDCRLVWRVNRRQDLYWENKAAVCQDTWLQHRETSVQQYNLQDSSDQDRSGQLAGQAVLKGYCRPQPLGHFRSGQLSGYFRPGQLSGQFRTGQLSGQFRTGQLRPGQLSGQLRPGQLSVSDRRDQGSSQDTSLLRGQCYKHQTKIHQNNQLSLQ